MAEMLRRESPAGQCEVGVWSHCGSVYDDRQVSVKNHQVGHAILSLPMQEAYESKPLNAESKPLNAESRRLGAERKLWNHRNASVSLMMKRQYSPPAAALFFLTHEATSMALLSCSFSFCAKSPSCHSFRCQSFRSSSTE